MNAAAVIGPKDRKEFWHKIVGYIAATIVIGFGCMCVLLLLYAVVDGLTGERNVQNTGVLSRYFGEPEEIARRIAEKRTEEDQWRFYTAVTRPYMSPTCVDPEKWPTMSQSDRRRWDEYFVWLNRRNEVQARKKNDETEFRFYYPLVGTEHCYLSEKRPLK